MLGCLSIPREGLLRIFQLLIGQWYYLFSQGVDRLRSSPNSTQALNTPVLCKGCIHCRHPPRPTAADNLQRRLQEIPSRLLGFLKCHFRRQSFSSHPSLQRLLGLCPDEAKTTPPTNPSSLSNGKQSTARIKYPLTHSESRDEANGEHQVLRRLVAPIQDISHSFKALSRRNITFAFSGTCFIWEDSNVHRLNAILRVGHRAE